MWLATTVARKSSCIKRQVGALIAIDRHIVSTGYNGTPRGIPNCNDGGCPRCNDPTIASGTRLDECWCSHGEENAIVLAACHGNSIIGGTLYTTASPCIQCAKMIANGGIVRVVYPTSTIYPSAGWKLLTKARIQCFGIQIQGDSDGDKEKINKA